MFYNKLQTRLWQTALKIHVINYRTLNSAVTTKRIDNDLCVRLCFLILAVMLPVSEAVAAGRLQPQTPA